MGSYFTLIAIVLFVISTIDIIIRKFRNPALGIVWFFVVLFIPIVGSIMYLLIRKGITYGVPHKFNPKFNH